MDKRTISNFKVAKEIVRKEIGGDYRLSGLIEGVITSPQGAYIREEKDHMLNLSAFDPLSLTSSERLESRGKESLERYGYGLSSVRSICGTVDIHKKLEGEISELLGLEDAVLFSSCSDANEGFFEAVLGPKDVLFADEDCHHSIFVGIKLCKGKLYKYKHLDMQDLRSKLENGGEGVKVIVTSGLFVDGEIGNLPMIIELGKEFGCVVMVDDSLGLGVLGEEGRGTMEYYGLKGISGVDVVTASFSGAFGSAGGFVACSGLVAKCLRLKARTYLFSNSLPPYMAAIAHEVIHMILERTTSLTTLNSNIAYFRKQMLMLGVSISGHPKSFICPIHIGATATQFVLALRHNGLILYHHPNSPLVLVLITAALTKDQIDHCIHTIIQLANQFQLTIQSKL